MFAKIYIGTPSKIKKDFRKDMIKESVIGLLVVPVAPILMANMVTLNRKLKGTDEEEMYMAVHHRLTGKVLVCDTTGIEVGSDING